MLFLPLDRLSLREVGDKESRMYLDRLETEVPKEVCTFFQ